MAIKIVGTTVIDDTRNLTSINTTATGNVTVTGFINATSTLAAGNSTITGFMNVSTNVSTNTAYATNSFNVGTAFTANSTVVNAVSYNIGTRVVANTTVVNATHLEGVPASSYVNTSANYTVAGNLTFSGNSIFTGSNSTINAIFRVVNSTANVFFAGANGNVGIGNTSPVSKLDVYGNYSLIVVAVAASDVDCSLGNFFTKTISGTTTFTFSNVPANRAYGFVLELTNGGSSTVNWPIAVKWPSGTAPTLTAAGVDVLTFITDDGGTTWRGLLSMGNSS